MGINYTLDRRAFMRGTAAATVALPLGGLLGSTSLSTSAFAQDAANPFSLADNSSIDTVVFNGGFGIDYVQFAADVLTKNHPTVKVAVNSSTKIATEVQPRFIGGNPPDLLDDSGADFIGWLSIVDQLEDLNSVLDAPNLEGTKIRDTLFGGVTAPGTFNGKLAAINISLTVYALWYSKSLFDANGWTPPTTWAEAKDLGAKAKEKGLYLFGWGKEAASYYLTTCIDSAIKEGGDEVRLALDNIKPGCWSLPAVQGAFNGLYDIIQAGYMHPGGSGTQFTAAQAQWSNDESWLLYPSGGWIENEMKKATKDGFQMTGTAELALTDNPKMTKNGLRATASEGFCVPSAGQNVAGGKEMLRTMLSKESATNFVKTKLAPMIVKDLVPADGFGSTALVSQNKLLADAGSNVFSWGFVDNYGFNQDMLPVLNTFLDGKMDVATLTASLQKLTDAAYNDPSVTKVEVK